MILSPPPAGFQGGEAARGGLATRSSTALKGGIPDNVYNRDGLRAGRSA